MATSFLFRIPEEDEIAFKVISGLDDPQFNALSTAIQATKPSLNPGDLTRQLHRNTNLEFMAENLPSVVRLVANLSRSIYQDNLKLDDVTARLAERAEKKELLAEGASREGLENRLRSLFSLEVVRLTSKAHAVLTSQPYAYGTSRIFTEIRPLFPDDEIVKAPTASVIAHQLYFDTLHNGSKSELFVALDDQDLRMLKGVIERAIRKSEVLIEQERQTGRIVIVD
jgi:hypothetical protein